MKGFTVTLTPRDESGVKRNREFYDNMKVQGLAGGGKIEMLDGSVLRCVWSFNRLMPDGMKGRIRDGFKRQLEEARERADNFTYSIEEQD